MTRKVFKAGERLQMMLSRETISGIIVTGWYGLHSVVLPCLTV